MTHPEDPTDGESLQQLTLRIASAHNAHDMAIEARHLNCPSRTCSRDGCIHMEAEEALERKLRRLLDKLSEMVK